ncbi:hypothetical protein FQA39_LY02514 [Lamprigera yunnana]|nr:hypothetical protein FQA39_LY02514 [Lamprigera yunnana]
MNFKMELKANDITETTIIPPTPLPTTFKRRSSIFRAMSDTGVNYSDKKLNEEYSNKIEKEIVEWKSVYKKIKVDYFNLRDSNENDHHMELDHNLKFEEYQQAVEKFCTGVNNMNKMNEHLCWYKSIREKHLKLLLKETEKKMCEKLNLP